jgi:transcriptional regulator with XRE-family HTH domain
MDGVSPDCRAILKTGGLKGMQNMKRRIGIAVRVRQIRLDLYGEDGLENVARALGVPAQTWRNYERGVTMPAEMLLEFMALTGADPIWLLSGDGERISSEDFPSRSERRQAFGRDGKRLTFELQREGEN